MALLIGGCGQADDGPAVYRVTGKVLVDGRPAARAQVIFHRSGGSANHPDPIAETDGDGNFSPTTRLTRDGAPAGDYTLTILWPEIQVDHGEEIAGRDRLNGFYRYTSTSNLKVNIKEGENLLPPFELSSTVHPSLRAAGRGAPGR